MIYVSSSILIEIIKLSNRDIVDYVPLDQCQDTPNTSYHAWSAPKRWSFLLAVDSDRMDAGSMR
jgi:hypothetical protein